jgi:hypothetical protein
MSMYRIYATSGDHFYSEVCFADDEIMAREIARSMFGCHADVEYAGELS